MPCTIHITRDSEQMGAVAADGHFASVDDSPRYAISMGAELVYEARTVVLVANGGRKTGPATESILGDVTAEVPISYGQTFVAGGGILHYVLDETTAAELLARRAEAETKGHEFVDMRGME